MCVEGNPPSDDIEAAARVRSVVVGGVARSPPLLEPERVAVRFLGDGQGLREVVRLRLGWVSVPPRGRLSTYGLPEYKQAAKAFIEPPLNALETVNLKQPKVQAQPYAGGDVRRHPGVRGEPGSAPRSAARRIAGTTSAP